MACAVVLGSELVAVPIIIISAIRDIAQNLAKIVDERDGIITDITEEDDESKRTAETMSVFNIRIAARVHHKTFSKPGLSKVSISTGLSEGLGEIVSENPRIGVSHGGNLTFVMLRTMYMLSITNKWIVHHEAHIIICQNWKIIEKHSQEIETKANEMN